jgi:hypothetical protein
MSEDTRAQAEGESDGHSETRKRRGTTPQRTRLKRIRSERWCSSMYGWRANTSLGGATAMFMMCIASAEDRNATNTSFTATSTSPGSTDTSSESAAT